MEQIAALIAALGGVEIVKYLLNRGSHRRIARVQAEVEEFRALREYNEFLQRQLRANDERYAEKTSLVRQLNAEIVEATADKAAARAELKLKRCDVIDCKMRKLS